MAAYPFLTSADYPSVRRAIDVGLTATELPDATIADPLFLDVAADTVLARDPLAESRTGAEETAIVNATIYLTAANLVRSLPRVMEERFADYSAKYDAMDVGATVSYLHGRAEATLAGLLGSRTGIPAFVLAQGRRGA